MLRTRVISGDLEERRWVTPAADHPYDFLILACGARHAYFGREEWEEHAPGLKTLEQAIEIRRRVLTAFQEAEKERSPERQQALLRLCLAGPP